MCRLHFWSVMSSVFFSCQACSFAHPSLCMRVKTWRNQIILFILMSDPLGQFSSPRILIGQNISFFTNLSNLLRVSNIKNRELCPPGFFVWYMRLCHMCIYYKNAVLLRTDRPAFVVEISGINRFVNVNSNYNHNFYRSIDNLPSRHSNNSFSLQKN